MADEMLSDDGGDVMFTVPVRLSNFLAGFGDNHISPPQSPIPTQLDASAEIMVERSISAMNSGELIFILDARDSTCCYRATIFIIHGER